MLLLSDLYCKFMNIVKLIMLLSNKYKLRSLKWRVYGKYTEKKKNFLIYAVNYYCCYMYIRVYSKIIYNSTCLMKKQI